MILFPCFDFMIITKGANNVNPLNYFSLHRTDEETTHADAGDNKPEGESVRGFDDFFHDQFLQHVRFPFRHYLIIRYQCRSVKPEKRNDFKQLL